MSVRGQLWTCAESLIATAPVFGVGAGNFADRNASCALRLDATWHGSANNWYLETAADLGAAGLALLAVFLGAMLLRARGAEVWSDPVAVGAYGAPMGRSANRPRCFQTAFRFNRRIERRIRNRSAMPADIGGGGQ